MQTQIDEIIKNSRRQSDKSRFGSELVSILDINGFALYISEAHTLVLGYEIDELRQRCMFDLVHPADRELVEHKFGHMVSSGEMTKIDFRFARKDGRWVEIRAEGVPLICNDIFRGFLIVSNTRIPLEIQLLAKEVANLLPKDRDFIPLNWPSQEAPLL